MATEVDSRERSPRYLGSQGVKVANWKQYRCFAVGVGYNGDGYHGFQIQVDGTRTVEKEIQDALISAGLIDPQLISEEGRFQLFWSRAARTDKGVHACMNVVACRLDSSRIKAEGKDLDQEFFTKLVNQFLPPSIRCMFINRVTMRFDARVHCDRRQYEYYIPRKIGSHLVDSSNLEKEMKKFEGTHNFHNFTRGLHPNDKSAQRHIISISVKQVDADFVCIQLYGQSFLLNQIRKMIGLALEVCLGLAPIDAVDHALTSGRLVHIHMVPGEGLLLDRLHFKGYDLHKCGDYLVTTPFGWMIQDEEGDGNPDVMNRINRFKNELVSQAILPKLEEKMNEWMILIVENNSWEKRHQ